MISDTAVLQSPPVPEVSAFAADARNGLMRAGQKELLSTYLYDAVGSALFEAITHLPEYGLTRADERLVARYSLDIANHFPGPTFVAELGSGTGRKTRHVLEAFQKRGAVHYFPIDVSATALRSCQLELSATAEVHPIHGRYLAGLETAVRARPRGNRLLLLFLGSTIGNFERHAGLEFLRGVHSLLLPGDGLLIGADLIKPVDQMILAYDDPAGVTAAFNLNILARINRELGGEFDLAQFSHQARYNETERRIEMHIESQTDQTARIRGAGITVRFQAGETIWTESSHKFDSAELRLLAGRTGFTPEAQWIDPEWPFAESLWLA